MKVTFKCHERTNRFVNKGIEWSLDMVLEGNSPWTICTYNKKPTQKQIIRDKNLILRAIQGYIKDVKIELPKIEEHNETIRKKS